MRTAAFTILALIAIGVSFNQSADAQIKSRVSVTYEVQVQYWFWDYPGAYYWSTVFETSNRDNAQLMYNLLLQADANGQLNNVVPSTNPRFIAVDVRMRTVINYTNRTSTFSYRPYNPGW